jgi:hypothetical protein
MKTKKIVAGACIALSLCLLVAALIGINSVQPKPAYGNVASGMPVFGSTQLVATGTNALCLSGTAATSIPCNNMLLTASATGALIGSTSATATFPLPSGLTTTTFPVTNVNQVWVMPPSSGTVTVNACYAQ